MVIGSDWVIRVDSQQKGLKPCKRPREDKLYHMWSLLSEFQQTEKISSSKIAEKSPSAWR